MPKDDFDDEEFKDEDAFDETETEEVEVRKPAKPITKPMGKPPMREEELKLREKFGKQDEARPLQPKYAAFHIAERSGILDSETKMPIGEDIMSILAVFKNDLEEIKKAVGV